MHPWSALAHNPRLLRAVEVAMVGDLTLRVFGHPGNGAADFGALAVAFSPERNAALALRFLRWTWQSPCGCGFFGDVAHDCACSDRLLERMRRQFRGRLFDINVETPRPRERNLVGRDRCEPHGLALDRAHAARLRLPQIQEEPKGGGALELLRAASDKLGFTLAQRAHVIRAARSIAALAGSSCDIGAAHMAEAVQYQSLPR